MKDKILKVLVLFLLLAFFISSLQGFLARERMLERLSFMPNVEEIEAAYVRTYSFPERNPLYYKFTDEELDYLRLHLSSTTVSRKYKWNEDNFGDGTQYALFLETNEGTVELNINARQLQHGDAKATYIIEDSGLKVFLYEKFVMDYLNNKDEN